MIELKPPEDEEVLTAKTLPCAAYTSNEVYERELARIFYSNWIMVCHKNDLKNVVDVMSFMIGTSSLIVVNSEGTTLKAFYKIFSVDGQVIH